MNRPDLPFLTGRDGTLILSIHVQPRASKNEICGIHGEELKVRLTSPPVEGAANKLCRRFFADLFKVPATSVEIISGETSRHKRVSIPSTSPGQLDAHISILEKALNSGHIH